MSNELVNYLEANCPKPNHIRIIDSDLEGYNYRTKKYPTRSIYPAYYEHDRCPDGSIFDTATILAQVLCGLNQETQTAVSLTNPTNLGISDCGLKHTTNQNRLTSDLDPALVSPISARDIYNTTLTKVKLCVDYRNIFPPQNLYQCIEVTSRWPEVNPIIQVQHINRRRDQRPSTAIEFHPLSSDGKTPAQLLDEYLSLFAPYYVGRLGLNILATSANRLSDQPDVPYYPAFHQYDPRFSFDEAIYTLRARNIYDTSVHLSVPKPTPRLAASIGPRVCLAATLAETHTRRHHTIDPESQEVIKEAVSRWKNDYPEVIDRKIARMHERAGSTQKWFDKKTQSAIDYPGLDGPAPRHPDKTPDFAKTLDHHLKSVGY